MADGRESTGRLKRRLILALTLALVTGAGTAAEALGQSARIEFELLPPDLALPHAPPLASPAWLGEAIVLQPWRATQHAALTDVGNRPQRLRREFGFNTIIVLPPEANNVGVLPRHRQTEEEFRAGLDAYRRAGYRVILYSSVVQSGMDPVWHNGHLGLVHPEWSQRDAEGRPLTKYGHPWLCPSSPALEYSLDYTERLARRYGADGIMLDNNQFFYTDEKKTDPSTWTCYCGYCQHRFRDYVVRRFGPERLKRVFGVDANGLRIPNEEGPLRALWIHWRNRVWAETNESFRERLRRVDPGMMFFANHQYDWPDGVLASDLQYEHEDVVLSESRELTSWHMSAKMLIGGALAGDRPLWNYVGTFEEKDYTRLRPQEVVGPIIGASLAHRARPWIVYFGFQDEQGNYQARREMEGLLSWYASHPGLFVGERWAPLGVVVSPLN
ncbi:MAG TPA: beta-galactosidase, partial [Rhodothermales bacterium]|nr:beta-galactosidase [Rhodothermales bacterium]